MEGLTGEINETISEEDGRRKRETDEELKGCQSSLER